MASTVPKDVMVVGKELAIVWEDGREDYIPLEKLRRNCPCAMCKGEKDIFGNVYKGKERPYIVILGGPGEVSEWLKEHAWKACVPKRYRGFESPPLRQEESGDLRSGDRVIWRPRTNELMNRVMENRRK